MKTIIKFKTASFATSWEAPVTTRNNLQYVNISTRKQPQNSVPNWNQVQSWDREYGDHSSTKQVRKLIFAQLEVFPTI